MKKENAHDFEIKDIGRNAAIHSSLRINDVCQFNSTCIRLGANRSIHRSANDRILNWSAIGSRARWILAWLLATRDIYRSRRKASRRSSVEHSIPHVISHVPARIRVNLSSGYHICSFAPPFLFYLASPARDLFLSFNVGPCDQSPTLRSSILSLLSSILSLLSRSLPLSFSHAAICLWFKTSGHLLHCLLTHTLERLRDGGTVLRSSRR